MELRQIFLPLPNLENRYVSYENQLQPRQNFETEQYRQMFLQNREELMSRTEKEIQLYLSDEMLCNDEEDMFPRPCEMTGEWYVSEYCFRHDYVSIHTHFLGFYKNDPERRTDDYLGLEVCFLYDEQTGSFELDGVNSEAL